MCLWANRSSPLFLTITVSSFLLPQTSKFYFARVKAFSLNSSRIHPLVFFLLSFGTLICQHFIQVFRCTVCFSHMALCHICVYTTGCPTLNDLTTTTTISIHYLFSFIYVGQNFRHLGSSPCFLRLQLYQGSKGVLHLFSQAGKSLLILGWSPLPTVICLEVFMEQHSTSPRVNSPQSPLGSCMDL